MSPNFPRGHSLQETRDGPVVGPAPRSGLICRHTAPQPTAYFVIDRLYLYQLRPGRRVNLRAVRRQRGAARGIVDTIEGNLEAEPDTRLVVVPFPSLLKACAWWHSPQYQAAAKLRRPPVSDSRVFLVDGIDLGNQQSPQHPEPPLP